MIESHRPYKPTEGGWERKKEYNIFWRSERSSTRPVTMRWFICRLTTSLVTQTEVLNEKWSSELTSRVTASLCSEWQDTAMRDEWDEWYSPLFPTNGIPSMYAKYSRRRRGFPTRRSFRPVTDFAAIYMQIRSRAKVSAYSRCSFNLLKQEQQPQQPVALDQSWKMPPPL